MLKFAGDLTPRQTFAMTSVIALIVANLIPLMGVLALGWSLPTIILLFWAETLVIGFYNILKIALVTRFFAFFLVPFFLLHFGGFMSVHLFFLRTLFFEGMKFSPKAVGGGFFDPQFFKYTLGILRDHWPATLAFVASHGVSFYVNFIRTGEYAKKKYLREKGPMDRLMMAVYKRVMILHVTLIFACWVFVIFKLVGPGVLSGQSVVLAFLVVLKTVVDLFSHLREHKTTFKQISEKRARANSPAPPPASDPHPL